MGIKLNGIHQLTNKLNKLSNIKAREAMEKTAKIVEQQLREEAKTFSKDGYKYIAQAEFKEYKNGSCYVDIGLKNDLAPWEKWKHLYFHHYGYNQFLWGKKSDKFSNMHQFWFTNAVDSLEKTALKGMKEELRKEIRDAMK